MKKILTIITILFLSSCVSPYMIDSIVEAETEKKKEVAQKPDQSQELLQKMLTNNASQNVETNMRMIQLLQGIMSRRLRGDEERTVKEKNKGVIELIIRVIISKDGNVEVKSE